jgi:hypothetical protein
VWVVEYSDGSFLTEYDEAGGRRGWKDIDVDRVKSMTIFATREGLASSTVKMTSPTMRPIFFRRRTLSVNLSEGEAETAGTVTCLGWQRTDTYTDPDHPDLEITRNVKAYAFHFGDGSVLITDDHNAV